MQKEALRRTVYLLSFDMIRTAQKTNKFGDTQTRTKGGIILQKEIKWQMILQALKIKRRQRDGQAQKGTRQGQKPHFIFKIKKMGKKLSKLNFSSNLRRNILVSFSSKQFPLFLLFIHNFHPPCKLHITFSHLFRHITSSRNLPPSSSSSLNCVQVV